MQKRNAVFIVDDDPSVRKGLANLMRAAGYDVNVFASAKEFLNALNSEIQECLVMDARMPGISGEELMVELKARSVDLSIIVITADNDPEIKRKAQKMKAAGFFRKPVDGIALLDTRNWALRKGNKSNNHSNV